jgi:hypothetical protein
MRALTSMGMAAVPLFAALIAIGAVTAGRADQRTPAAGADAAASGPVRCEIQKVTAGGTLTLTPIVRADMAVSGSYKFKVTGGSRGGSSTIDQGGPFAVTPDTPAGLSTVSLSAGGTYDASLTISWKGATVACSERIGGI